MPTATGSSPSHHVTLEAADGTGSTYGLVLCNAQGIPNARAIERNPSNRTSIKTQQGSTKYADLQGDYISIPQDDWTGGRGAEDFDLDSSRFFDSYRMNTWMPGRAILGPQVQFGTGYRDQDNLMPGSVTWTGLYGDNRYLANKFTASIYDADKCYIWMRKIGTPNGGVTLELCADGEGGDAGDPGTVLKTASSSAYHLEVDKVADFDAETDTESDLNDSADAAQAGAVGLEVTFDSTTAAYGRMDFNAVDQTTAVVEFYFDKNDVAGDDGLIILVTGVDGASNTPFRVLYFPATSAIWFQARDIDSGDYVTAYGGTCPSGYLLYRMEWGAGSAPNANDGYLRVYRSGVLLGQVVDVDNDGLDVDVVRAGMTWSNTSAGHGGSYYMDTLKIGLLGAWDITDTVSVFRVFDWATTETLSAASFHIKVYAESDSDDATDHWEVGCRNIEGTTQYSALGSTWATAAFDLYFRIVDADDPWIAQFYDYKGQLYFATKPDDGSAAQIFINGDRGAADSNSGDKTLLNDSSKGAVWTADEWIGSIAVITDGPGSDDELNWRAITGNTTVALTVTPAWDTAHSATATDYAIVSSNKWTEISGAGLTVPVTDVLVSKDVVYYAQGDDVAHRRHREYNDSGTWTNDEWDDDGGSNKSKFLLSYRDAVNGQQVGMVTNEDTNSDVSFARADAQVWGTDLTFGTPIPCGDRGERATGLDLYGGLPYVFKEGSIWFVSNDISEDLALREMQAVKSYKNGRAHLVHGVYLYTSLLHSLERYFRSNFDDIGYGVDAGLPADRQGVIYHMEGYPGYFLCAVDGGASNYSSILLTYGHQDWHELYRAPEVGQRIRRLHMQPIPGSAIDRLWFSMGPDACWLPMPSDTFDPYRDSNYPYTHEGHIVSAWHYASLHDVIKFWGSIKVFAENLTTDEQYIEAEYQIDNVDETDTWTAINGTFDTSPLEEVDIKSDNTVTARRFRFRLRFLTTDSGKTPKMTANLIEAIGTVKPKWEYSMTFRVADENVDIEGDDDSYVAAETIQAQMDTWAGAQTPLTQRCVYVPYDNKTVFATALPLKPVSVITDEGLEVQVGQLVVYEK